MFKGNDIENAWLIVYMALWAFSIYKFWKKEKRFSATILILSSYFGYSIVSFYLYNISYPEYKGIGLFPFLFQFLMVLIALRPVTQYCGEDDIEISKPNEQMLKIFIIVWTACCLFSFIKFLPDVTTGIFRILTDVYAGQDIYDETMEGASQIGNGTSIANLPIVFSNVFADVGTLLVLYYISTYKVKKVYLLLMFVAVMAPFFQSISLSQRGPAIDRLYSIAITYMILRPYYSSKFKKVARIVAFAIGGVLVVVMTAITLSRFGMQSDEGAIESVYSYVGMENLNFNLYAFDNNGLRYGDRTAPMFKRMIGFRDVPTNFMERRKKYPHLKIDDGVFIGFVGDFCLDYGPIISFILFVIFSSVFCQKTRPKRNKLEIHQLIFIQFAACVCMCGGMKLFSFSDLGNLKIIAVLMSYWFFKYFTK